jgi:hypothetical protein
MVSEPALWRLRRRSLLHTHLCTHTPHPPPFTPPHNLTGCAADKDKDLAANMARFAFCKEDDSLVEACKRLLALRSFAIDKTQLPPLAE